MTKAIEMGETSARGGFHLFLGVALSSVISSLGTIIPLESGSNADEFFLTFEQIGDASDERDEPIVIPGSLVPTDQEPEIGLRDFAEVNASMSVITGVPITNSNVVNTYNTVKQQLPMSTSIEGFLSAFQSTLQKVRG